MFALLTPGLVAALLAFARGRSLSAVTRLHVAWWPLGLASLAVELGLTSTPLGHMPFMVEWGSAVWIVAMAATAAVLVRNAWASPIWQRLAWAAAALGVAINLLVVVANDGHMPQSQAARLAAGASAAHVAGLADDGAWHNVAPMSPETRLAWLGDVLPEPEWLPSRNVMSVGDLLLALGLAALVYVSGSPTGGRTR